MNQLSRRYNQSVIDDAASDVYQRLVSNVRIPGTSRLALSLLMGLTALLGLQGCSSYNPKYQHYYTYAQTRKVVDANVNAAFKVVWAPLLFIPETVISPVTSYMDAVNHPPESQDKHVYLTYVGSRTATSHII